MRMPESNTSLEIARRDEIDQTLLECGRPPRPQGRSASSRKGPPKDLGEILKNFPRTKALPKARPVANQQSTRGAKQLYQSSRLSLPPEWQSGIGLANVNSRVGQVRRRSM